MSSAVAFVIQSTLRMKKKKNRLASMHAKWYNCVYIHIPNGDDLLFAFIMLSYVCYVALLCIFHSFYYFDDITRLPIAEHQVHTYRLFILIIASHMVKPDNIASKILTN